MPWNAHSLWVVNLRRAFRWLSSCCVYDCLWFLFTFWSVFKVWCEISAAVFWCGGVGRGEGDGVSSLRTCCVGLDRWGVVTTGVLLHLVWRFYLHLQFFFESEYRQEICLDMQCLAKVFIPTWTRHFNLFYWDFIRQKKKKRYTIALCGRVWRAFIFSNSETILCRNTSQPSAANLEGCYIYQVIFAT